MLGICRCRKWTWSLPQASQSSGETSFSLDVEGMNKKLWEGPTGPLLETGYPGKTFLVSNVTGGAI